MPKIQEYSQRTTAPGPVDQRRAQAADFGFGPAVAGLGESVQNVGEVLQKRKEQQEVSDLTAKLTVKHAEFTNKWKEALRTADPGDTELADRFIKGAGDELNELKDNVQTKAGRQYFDQTAATIQGHLLTTTVEGQAELAGIKAKEDYTTSLNALSSSLVGDPSSFQIAAVMHEQGIDHLVQNGNLPRETAEKLRVAGRTELAKSSVRGWIENSPEEAKKQLKDGKWDGLLGGDQKVQLMGEADTAIRARDIENERIIKKQKEAMELQQKDTQNGFLVKLNDGTLSTKDILNSNLNPTGSGSKDQFLNMLQKDDGRLKTDPGVQSDIFNRIHLPDGDANKITDENDLNQYFGKGINKESLTFLRGEVQNRKTSEGKIESDLQKSFLDMARSKLVSANPMLGIRDPEGEESNLKFQTEFFRKVQEFKKQKKDVSLLIDPNSPDYFGKALGNYTKTPQQIIQSSMRANAPKIEVPEANPVSGVPLVTLPAPSIKVRPPRLEGENPADYLKRMKESK